MKFSLILALGLQFLLLGCSQSDRVKVSFQDAATEKAGAAATFSAEVVSTNSSREIGLMYRKELGEDDAMLFIFPNEAERSFWMKNTYVELDMVFISAANKVVSITERAVPLSETPRMSKEPAQYVLEIKGGRSKALGLHPGMLMHVDGNLPTATY